MMQNYIENVLFNQDIFDIIFSFFSFSNQAYMFKVSHHFLENSKRVLCNYCNKICCPIIYNDEIMCYSCVILVLIIVV